MAPFRVLIADDNAFMLDILRDSLTHQDFQVVGEAANGLEAVNLFRLHHPDIIILDMVMPFSNGIRATREIREIASDALIVIATALGEQSATVAEAKAAGAVDTLVKPFQGPLIRDKLLKVLESSWPERPASSE